MLALLLDHGERDGWLLHCAGGDTSLDPLAGAVRMSLGSLEIEMLALLLERGADPNERLPNGETPLMLLARQVYLKEIYGRPPYVPEVLGSPSPYYERWFAPMLALLLEHGADPSLRDHAGLRAADHVPSDDHDREFKRAALGEGSLPASDAP